MNDWSKHQEKIFAVDSVIEEVLKNPMQRERVDIAIKMISGPGLKVLDMGCGDGGISELIHDRGNEVVAMDLPLVIATVPDKRKTWLTIVPGDANVKPWPFQDEEFPVVFIGEIIEHMVDIELFLTEAWRVLKPDGKIVLTTPNAVRELNRISMLLGSVESFHEWHKPIHHIRYFTPKTICDALTKYGFEPEEVGFGRSQGEVPLESIQEFSPEERRVLRRLMDRYMPNPVWKHSFIVVKARKAERLVGKS